MCGRFALHLLHQEIRDLEGYDVNIGEWVDQQDFVPRYNIAPRTRAPIIRRRNAGSNGNRDDLVIQTMKWGLIPHWSKYEDKTLSTTNARSENLAEGAGMWNSIKGKKRCAIICEGYYEWLTKGKDKLPHFTKHKSRKLMLLAGLYDSVVLEGQTEPLWTFTIVTTAACKDFEWLHDRQPVIITSKEALDKWLNTSSQTWNSDLGKFVCQSYHDRSSPLECYQVPKEVGKVGNESSTYIEPITARRDGIQAMFSKQKAAAAQKSPSGSQDSQEKKRKREEEPSSLSSSSARKTNAKIKMEKQPIPESDDDEIEIIEKPPEAKKPKFESAPKSPKPKTPEKTPKGKGAGNKSITSFFSPKT
ncbi:hypothetical protein D9758_007877 [Tetrapyrgos nigripes]|uniref:DUF159-domain-containing protein n=1 Tax=Tetrapyrgos nigripes TaxID=182062 RepID=A0A8H5FXU6_9AGAR|nr:hypothetical protein D9758_007877 [Tetrapyrgos nigripes]